MTDFDKERQKDMLVDALDITIQAVLDNPDLANVCKEWTDAADLFRQYMKHAEERAQMHSGPKEQP